jgi:thioredoxin-related protein
MRKMNWEFELLLLTVIIVGAMILGAASPTAASAWRDAPSFYLYDISGKEIQFTVSDNMVVLLFMSPDCFACDRELFMANILQKNLSFQLVPVCIGCNWKEVKRIQESLNLELPIYMGKVNLKASWGIWEFPTAFLVDKNMKILEKWQGKIAVQSLEKQLANREMVQSKRKKADGDESPSACSDGVCY